MSYAKETWAVTTVVWPTSAGVVDLVSFTPFPSRAEAMDVAEPVR